VIPSILPQDLHVHTVFSRTDGAVVPEQTPELIRRIAHARTIGISDHFEHFAEREYDDYVAAVTALGFLLGTEVDGAASVAAAAALRFDYYIYHCYDHRRDYRGLERLLATGRPVIVAHPNALGTDLGRLPPECLVEINNRYVWRCDWLRYYGPYRERFRFVIGSDAHSPNWLGQSVARRAAAELEISETLVAPLLAENGH
jgi:histidinol phosphatase-like PHP family hydrolase